MTMGMSCTAHRLQAGKFATIFATLIVATAGGVTAAAAQTESVLYSFAGGTGDGAQPFAGLSIDTTTGNLYGATFSGGSYGQGIVFELPSGATSDTVLCNLPGGNGSGALNGAGPWGTPVFWNGNVYGTATYDSISNGSVLGNGVVYECAANGSGYTVLHQFKGGTSDGTNPFAGLFLDSTHTNLYGTTVAGGTSSNGVVFQQPISGTASTILHSFAGGSSDGAQPYGGVIIDPHNNLAGATVDGSTLDNGIIYITPIGSWTSPAIAKSFGSSSNGEIARSTLLTDKFGNNYYGTTMLGGGVASDGVVFDLFALGGGRYSYSLLHIFTGGSSDGAQPYAALIEDASGNLYGTTTSGGASGYGVVYELTPNGSGGYNETILHSFAGGTSDGANPYSALVMDSSGNLYGTTANGGANGHGTIFEIAMPTTLTQSLKQKR
ncbi:MAG: choice-of-anchor tandem repeat GloVer-containing protein [Pseudomonadota bacterium]